MGIYYLMDQLDVKVESVVNKIKHYLITTMGKTAETASDDEFYRAFSLALREEVMINWTATNNTIESSKVRRVYYLSMEYMPGRLLGNNLTNISAIDLVKQVLHSMDRDFSHVMSMEPEIGIGNGGLGRLASCFMDSLATLEYPAMGYGMRYQYGIFEQDIKSGVQIERPECWLIRENPWEFRRDNFAVEVQYAGKIVPTKNGVGDEVHDISCHEQVRALPYDYPIIGYDPSPDFSVSTLRLWSTKESPRNFQLQRYNAGQIDEASENTSLTDVLYPNDNHDAGKRIRLKQEFLLVSASLQDIINQHLLVFGNMDEFADKVRIQINDTHPALVISELTRLLVKEHNHKWDQAFDVVKTVCSYTNHTVLKEALEEWNVQRVEYLLPRQYKIIQWLNDNFCKELKQKHSCTDEQVKKMSIIEAGQIRMAHLAIYGSHHVNGVAALHTQILKDWMFKDFYGLYPEKFINVTNGVTQRRWLLYCNPKLSQLITDKIGNGWIRDFAQIEKLKDYAACSETQKIVQDIKRENKTKLLEFLNHDYTSPVCTSKTPALLDENAIFDIHIKRFHEYKRQFMNALHALMVYQEIKENPSARSVARMVMFGGKAAPGYQRAKDIIRFIYCLSRAILKEKNCEKLLRVVFVQNYNVSKAEKLIPACDLSEQISTAGMEASGTGNMKLSINGALTIGTEDGANVEMHASITDKWWPFSFGGSCSENAKLLEEKTYNPNDICMKNEKIKKAMDALIDGSLAESDEEKESLQRLHTSIFDGPSSHLDRYFVLRDLQAYYDTQKKVETLYQDKTKWTETVIHNIAGMGPFSSDNSIKNYAENIWDIKPCPPLSMELERIRKEYSELDRCRIIPGMKKAQ